ncbi:MAG: galactose mutarotase [Akkermansiaceae bacterium]|nr:galactose mutarotase [Akkermansiaceae bacterium]
MKNPFKSVAVFLSVASTVAAASIKEEKFGEMPDGQEVKIFTLENGKGMRVKVTEYGAILASVEAPDRNGKSAELTHGHDTLEGWLKDTAYFGATVGRFGNRIADGKFTLDGKEYTLAKNNSPGGMPCSLHGGKVGFNKVLWKGTKTADGVEFTYLSKDGEEGFPGNLSVKVTYTLNDDNELGWHATATTDTPTVVNLVQHAYWNISGDPAAPVTDQLLTLEADHYLPTNKGLIPTGEQAPVAGTPMDFTKPTEIGKGVGEDFEALKLAGGYDHAWVLRPGSGVRKAATVEDPKSGRILTVSTDAPAIHFYLGNFLDGSVKGRGGVPYHKRTALCLETEAFPDAPNQPSFPSTVLRPGETYQHRIIFKFAVR